MMYGEYLDLIVRTPFAFGATRFDDSKSHSLILQCSVRDFRSSASLVVFDSNATLVGACPTACLSMFGGQDGGAAYETWISLLAALTIADLTTVDLTGLAGSNLGWPLVGGLLAYVTLAVGVSDIGCSHTHPIHQKRSILGVAEW